MPQLVAILDHYFPPDNNNLDSYKRGIPIETEQLSQVCTSKLTFKYIE